MGGSSTIVERTSTSIRMLAARKQAQMKIDWRNEERFFTISWQAFKSRDETSMHLICAILASQFRQLCIARVLTFNTLENKRITTT